MKLLRVSVGLAAIAVACGSAEGRAVAAPANEEGRKELGVEAGELVALSSDLSNTSVSHVEHRGGKELPLRPLRVLQEDEEGKGEEDHDHDHDHELEEGEAHEHGSKGNWRRILNVVIAAVVVGIVSVIGVCLPSLVRRVAAKHGEETRLLVESLCNAFAAGGFWGLAFLHVMFEAVAACQKLKYGLKLGHENYNAAYPLAAAGYALMVIVESLAGVASVKAEERLHMKEVHSQSHTHPHTLTHSNTLTQSHDQTLDHARHDHSHDDASRNALDKGLKAGMKNGKNAGNGMNALTHSYSGEKGSDKATEPRSERRAFGATDAVIASLALTAHSFFEGLVIGMRDEPLLIWIAAVAVIGHKWAAGFALSARMEKNGTPRRTRWVTLSIFCLASPVGAIVGLPLALKGETIAVATLNAFSAGILFYVAGETTQDTFKCHTHPHGDMDHNCGAPVTAGDLRDIPHHHHPLDASHKHASAHGQGSAGADASPNAFALSESAQAVKGTSRRNQATQQTAHQSQIQQAQIHYSAELTDLKTPLNASPVAVGEHRLPVCPQGQACVDIGCCAIECFDASCPIVDDNAKPTTRCTQNEPHSYLDHSHSLVHRSPHSVNRAVGSSFAFLGLQLALFMAALAAVFGLMCLHLSNPAPGHSH